MSGERFTRVRELGSFVRNPKRYVDDSDTANEDEIYDQTDASEWRDGQTPTISQRLASRKVQVMTFGYLAIVVALIIGVYSRQYAPGLYGDPWVREGVKWLILVPVIGAIAARKKHNQFASVDELTLSVNGEGHSMYGEYDTDADGNRIFRPYRGFVMFGMSPQPLTLADLGKKFGKTFAKARRAPDDPAVIRLEDGVCTAVDTATGTEVHVLTSGLAIDPYADDSDVYTQPPDIVDEDAYDDLVKTLEKVYGENANLMEQISTLERQLGEWKRDAKMSREEIIQDFLDDHEKLAEITEKQRPRYGGGGPRQRHSTNGNAEVDA